MRGRWVLRGAGFAVLAVAFLAGLSFVVMSLWNALIPAVFHGPAVSYWQAAGLLVLSRILFGGLRGGGAHGWRHRRWHAHWERMSPEERSRFRDGFRRWRHMSREERAEFRQRFHGCGPAAAPQTGASDAPRTPQEG
ncbi:MAG TPA: DUF3106 domain-containing protein [Steroidobacteraceae bacterium]|nr:DUF3106 domain-containing protein [Steroidobacteraceae bacterium]